MQKIQRDSRQLASFENLFFEHYVDLHKWALQLARGNRWEAEDLVQELYVELARISTDIEEIRSHEDYLFSILRNLQYARLRRAGKSAIDELSIVDFDSIERGLAAVDRNKLLLIRDDLHRVCDYVCERKNSSRTASILILRFFLGYFPAEIMSVTQSSRVAVTLALQASRHEAKLALERPGVLTSIGSPRTRRVAELSGFDNPLGLFADLRDRISLSCVGKCFSRDALQQKYADPNSKFSVEELAHLVSCMQCLDEANKVLGLPPLGERSPDETLGRDNRPGGGAGGVSTISSRKDGRGANRNVKRWSQARRHVREIDEHRPQRLLIAVDGDIRVSQKVTSEWSELHARLHRDEKPTFVEVLSEQGVRMALLLVAAPDAKSGLNLKQNRRLSDGRSLEVTFSFADETPWVWADYHDPLLAQDLEADLEGENTKPLEAADSSLIAVLRDERSARPSRISIGWLRQTKDLLSRWKRAAMSEINPFLASALLLGCASLICFFFWIHSGSRVSADMLLEKATTQNNQVETAAQGVIYQKVRISSPRQTFERTIYRDPQRKRHTRTESLSGNEERLKTTLLTTGVSWDDPLSAANYKDWHDHHVIERDSVDRTGQHLLTLTTTLRKDPLVLEETLTVRDSDFHPVKRTVDLRDTGTIEIAELNYDVLPWAAVNDNWFEPLGGSVEVRDLQRHPSALAHLPTPLTEAELDAAELDVRLALNDLGADTDLRISLSRQVTGLRVKGIVATDDRKQEIEARLASIPHVFPSIFTFFELRDEPVSNSQNTSLEAVSDSESTSPLEDYLIHHNWQREEAQHLSEQLLDAAVSINQEGRAISELLREFGSGKNLPPNSTITLSTLLLRRKDHLRKAIAAQQETLSLLENHSLTSDEHPSDEELAVLADRNLVICKTLIKGNGTAEADPNELLEKLNSFASQLEILALHVPTSPSAINPASTASSQNHQTNYPQ